MGVGGKWRLVRGESKRSCYDNLCILVTCLVVSSSIGVPTVIRPGLGACNRAIGASRGSRCKLMVRVINLTL